MQGRDILILANIKKIIFYSLILSILLPSLYVRFNNVIKFDILKGYDGILHFCQMMDYAENKGIPSAYATLESYQPPLYYFLCSLPIRVCIDWSPSLTAFILKLISTLSGLVIIWCAIKVYMLLFGYNAPGLITILLFLSSLPMHIYISPMLGNEMVSACFISLALVSLISTIKYQAYTAKKGCIVGVLIGCALLTKYTGILLCVTFIATAGYLLIVCKDARRQIVIFASTAVACMVLIAGWWYVRNSVLYGDPLIKSNDLAKFASTYTRQPPGHHTIRDFLFFDTRIFNDPVLAADGDFKKFWYEYKYNLPLSSYNTAYNSVSAGTFATMWIDNHGYFSQFSSKGFILAKKLLLFAVIPLLMVAAGITLMTIKCVSCKHSEIHLMLFPICFLVIISMASYVLYNLKYPYFCHVKAFFLMHLLVPFSCAIGYMADLIARYSFLLLVLILTEYVAVYLIVMKLYTL